nr:immunoglobulin heavy chain junction region [Macaca mulatta]
CARDSSYYNFWTGFCDFW